MSSKDRIFTKGIKQANKVMLMSARAYNIKKYLKFTQQSVQSNRAALAATLFWLKKQLQAIFTEIEVLELSKSY